MKGLMVVVFCAAALLAAGTAHAYAIYNHLDRELCVQTPRDRTIHVCKYIIPAHGTYNGGHGAGLSFVFMVYKVSQENWRENCTEINISKGGYARVYHNEVKVYKHDGTYDDWNSSNFCDSGYWYSK